MKGGRVLWGGEEVGGVGRGGGLLEGQMEIGRGVGWGGGT